MSVLPWRWHVHEALCVSVSDALPWISERHVVRRTHICLHPASLARLIAWRLLFHPRFLPLMSFHWGCRTQSGWVKVKTQSSTLSTFHVVLSPWSWTTCFPWLSHYQDAKILLLARTLTAIFTTVGVSTAPLCRRQSLHLPRMFDKFHTQVLLHVPLLSYIIRFRRTFNLACIISGSQRIRANSRLCQTCPCQVNKDALISRSRQPCPPLRCLGNDW